MWRLTNFFLLSIVFADLSQALDLNKKCAEEVSKYCRDNENKISKACIKKHERSFSKNCREQLTSLKNAKNINVLAAKGSKGNAPRAQLAEEDKPLDAEKMAISNNQDPEDFQSEAYIKGPSGTIAAIIALLFILLTMYSWWKIIRQSGGNFWAFLLPPVAVYHLITVFKKPKSWAWAGVLCFFLAFVPIIGILCSLVFPILWLVLMMKLADCYGKKKAFGVGMFLLPVIFMTILVLNKVEFTAPA